MKQKKLISLFLARFRLDKKKQVTTTRNNEVDFLNTKYTLKSYIYIIGLVC